MPGRAAMNSPATPRKLDSETAVWILAFATLATAAAILVGVWISS